MGGTLRFLRALVATNLKASFALRGAFWMQVFFMLFNNLIFFVMWWIFFDRFEEQALETGEMDVVIVP